jgi:hypothetical protein
MYRCYACKRSISLWRAIGSSEWFPVVCRDCGAEQHRPISSLRVAAVWLAAFPAFLILLVAVSIWSGRVEIALIGIVALTGGVLLLEEHLFERGVLVATSRKGKRRARISWTLFLVALLSAWGFAERFGA